jgi:hypothetical protein
MRMALSIRKKKEWWPKVIEHCDSWINYYGDETGERRMHINELQTGTQLLFSFFNWALERQYDVEVGRYDHGFVEFWPDDPL